MPSKDKMSCNLVAESNCTLNRECNSGHCKAACCAGTVNDICSECSNATGLCIRCQAGELVAEGALCVIATTSAMPLHLAEVIIAGIVVAGVCVLVMTLGCCYFIARWREPILSFIGPIVQEPCYIVQVCPICNEENAPGIRIGCQNVHELCMRCALRVTRDELRLGAQSIRCPCCLANAVAGTISPAAVRAVAAWSRVEGRHDAVDDLRPLSDDEMRRYEAMVLTQQEAEAAPPLAFGKLCPRCHTRGVHYRGHHCHHISPGTGCLGCGIHYCYVCLREYVRDGQGRPSRRCDCPLFCWPACDCQDCTDCRPG